MYFTFATFIHFSMRHAFMHFLMKINACICQLKQIGAIIVIKLFIFIFLFLNIFE